jgi:hypothetical protein
MVSYHARHKRERPSGRMTHARPRPAAGWAAGLPFLLFLGAFFSWRQRAYFFEAPQVPAPQLEAPAFLAGAGAAGAGAAVVVVFFDAVAAVAGVAAAGVDVVVGAAAAVGAADDAVDGEAVALLPEAAVVAGAAVVVSVAGAEPPLFAFAASAEQLA